VEVHINHIPNDRQMPIIWGKILKISPVNPEIIGFQLKKKEIMEGKIYSPVGKFAERAK